ncbi:putative transcription factor WD40-like family [Medicago truncatula]|uniref:Putative transcription factor WD40-like family n=1 Tax=Medicago truncatula TaxID=3880 RepID=A0A396HWJ0_MEDTR|nr:putative transcription factor WD40-like family [Medicago truncatula]
MVPSIRPCLLKKASGQADSITSNDERSKKLPENQFSPLISADEYASRSAMLYSLVVSWSPLLRVASEFYPDPNTCASVSLLAVGAKSGKISFWRFHQPDCYTIEERRAPTAVKFVGFLRAHNSWITTMSWLLFAYESSNPLIILATGSSDGSVKVWLGDTDKLLKSSEVDQTSFLLLKEVITVNAVPVSVLSVTVHVQYPSKMLLAIGKVSGSIEIWICDISSREFDKLGSYDAHYYGVTGLTWAFGGRFLCSCSQDNLLRGWILHERCLEEITILSEMPRSNDSTCPSRDAFDSCFGVAVSPGNLIIATVHCFDVDKLNRMYEGRILKAAIEYFWIGGLQVDDWLKSPFSCYIEELPSFPEKELTYWGANVIWSLNQYQCLDKPLIFWDIIAALLAFKDNKSKYVEHLVIKWLSLSFLGSHLNLPAEEVLSRVISRLSDIPSRLLHLLNIMCRRVMLAQLDADQITRINSKVQNIEVVCPVIEEQMTKWIEILLVSERELRERQIGFSFSAVKTAMSHLEEPPAQPGRWYPVGLAQMEKWVALNQEHVRDQLKFIVSKVTHEKRYCDNFVTFPLFQGTFYRRLKTDNTSEMWFVTKRCSTVESCSYCSAPVPFDSPEFGFCQSEKCTGGNVKRHKLLRCAVSMEVCPSSPLWLCVCCHRYVFRLAPEALFRMSSSSLDSDSSNGSSSRAVSSKPLCPFCGILLQRKQPDFLLSTAPV